MPTGPGKGFAVRITAIEPFVCDGGLREFGFLRVTTDDGIVGWAETYDWHTSAALATGFQVMGRRLIGMAVHPLRTG